MSLRNASVCLLRFSVIAPIWMIGFIMTKLGDAVAFSWNRTIGTLEEFVEFLDDILPEVK